MRPREAQTRYQHGSQRTLCEFQTLEGKSEHVKKQHESLKMLPRELQKLGQNESQRMSIDTNIF